MIRRHPNSSFGTDSLHNIGDAYDNGIENVHFQLNRHPSDHFKNGHSSSHHLRGAKTIISRRAMMGLGCASLSFLLAVHMYLFLTAMHGNDNMKMMNNDNFHNVTQNSVPSPRVRGSKEVSLTNFPTLRLTPLQSIDQEFYTIRINTWRRPKQLVASVLHHASCPGAKTVQVVWCDKENKPPSEILDPNINPHASKVVIERHEANSLNERFHILDSPDTLGILSIDDDVLRPCEAIDSGFFQWVHSPHRMVGFDARAHVENEDGTWAYGYLSTTREQNRYSMSLTRYCFIHRDYMKHYMEHMPSNILETVAKNFNCEDIAMSFMISSLTKGNPPLLADAWAMNTQMKLRVDDKISGGKDHKHLRDQCVDSFAQQMGLKDGPNRLQKAKILRSKHPIFESGAEPDGQERENYSKCLREIQHYERIQKWKTNGTKTMKDDIGMMMRTAGMGAYKMGLLGSTEDEKKKKKQQQEQ